MKNTPDARNRILDAALKVFAEKSFDGARIDEISKEANVPKSLIYYHFKSKEELFHELSQKFISEYADILDKSVNTASDEKKDDMAYNLTNNYYDFAARNVDLIRILLIDSLKKSSKHPAIFEIVKILAEYELKSPTVNKTQYDRTSRLVGEFFTNILPNCVYICLAGSFSETFGIGMKELGKSYLTAMQASHEAFHNELERGIKHADDPT